MRRSILILVTAFLIIGMREVCMGQYSRNVSIQTTAPQQSNDTLSLIPIDESSDLESVSALQFSRTVSHPVQERIRGGFVFRVKRFLFKTLESSAWKPGHMADCIEGPCLNTVKFDQRSFAAGPVRIDSEVTSFRRRKYYQ